MYECFILPIPPNQNERKLSFNIKGIILDFLKVKYNTRLSKNRVTLTQFACPNDEYV